MSSENSKNQSMDELFSVALAELQGADLAKAAADTKKQIFAKTFKLLTSEKRLELTQRAAVILREKYSTNERMDGLIFLLVRGFSTERDWESVRGFLAAVLTQSSDADFSKEVAIILLDIADNELGNASAKAPLGQTALVLITELGLMIANAGGQSHLDLKGSQRVVEYITTSLLARSNVNNNAMRMSLVYYLTKCGSKGQSTQQLNRVISRFGQSLLDEMLTAVFEDKKRESAAFYFLLEHMNAFFTASPALAEMSHSVLRHFMLKYPDEFGGFMASYAELVPRDESRLRMTTKHIALLVRSAVEVSQKTLADTLNAVLRKHLQIFVNTPNNILEQEIQLCVQILTSGHVQRHSKIVLDDFAGQLSSVLVRSKKDNVVLLFKGTKRLKESQPKLIKLTSEPSPLESMLLLAS